MQDKPGGWYWMSQRTVKQIDADRQAASKKLRTDVAYKPGFEKPKEVKRND